MSQEQPELFVLEGTEGSTTFCCLQRQSVKKKCPSCPSGQSYKELTLSHSDL